MSVTEEGLAERVSSQHNSDLVKDFNLKSNIGNEIIKWSEKSGLSLEFAKIQPGQRKGEKKEGTKDRE